MTDTLTPSERSKRMSLVRAKNTRPEIALRSGLHSLGLRYRLHWKKLPGSPDLVFRRYKAVVFVHGCFWHRHPGCHLTRTPKSNQAFWNEKFEKNVARDASIARSLKHLGWSVFIVWECELASTTKAIATCERITTLLREKLTIQH